MSNELIFNEKIIEQDFPWPGVHLVAASAGTGKTHNIQNIYARLIMEKGWRVSEIQVMTFTDAATKELRERLRSILADVQLRLDGQPCPGKGKTEKERCDDMKSRNKTADELIKACPTTITKKAMKAAIGLALMEFDSAAISTIHGFCRRALGRYSFETHTTFAPEIEDNKHEELTRRTLDWWRARTKIASIDLLPKLNLDIMKKYVHDLGEKPNAKLDGYDSTTPNGFMLEEAKKIVDEYVADRVNRQKQTFDDILRAMRDALYDKIYGDKFAKSLRETFRAALIDEFQDTDPVQYEIFKKVFLADQSIPVFFVGDPKQAIYAFRGGDIFTYLNAIWDVPENRNYYLDTNFRSTPRLMAAVNAIFRDTDNQFTFGNSQIDYPRDIKPNLEKPKAPLMVNGQDDPKPFCFIEVNGDLYKALAQEVVNTLNVYKIESSDGCKNLSPKDIAILVFSHKNAKKIMTELLQCGVPCTIEKPGNVFSTVKYENNQTYYSPSRMLREFLTICQAMAKMGGERQARTALATSFFGLTPIELLELQKDEYKLAEWIDKFDKMNRIWLKHGLGAALAKMEEYGTQNGVGYRERLALLPDGERLLADCGQIIELSFAAVKKIGPSPADLVAWLKNRMANGESEKDSDEYARELESDSEAVHIITMHKSKGLQFPVVFLPDCDIDVWEQKPNDLVSYHNDTNGTEGTQLFFSILGQDKSKEPIKEEQSTPGKKAMEEERQEKMRLLYVAMTRAKQRTVAFYSKKVEKKDEVKKSKKAKKSKSSTDAGETTDNTEAIKKKSPLEQLMENAKKNEAAHDFPIQWIEDYMPSAEPPHYAGTQQPCNLAKPSTLPTPPTFEACRVRGSYTAISPSFSNEVLGDKGQQQDRDANDKGDKQNPLTDNRLPIFCIPRGTIIGSCWHEVLEEIAFNADKDAIRKVVKSKLEAYGFDPEKLLGKKSNQGVASGISQEATEKSMLNVTCDMIEKVLSHPIVAPDGNVFRLCDVTCEERLSEQEFNFSSADSAATTAALSAKIRAHWQGDSTKQEFINAMAKWDRSIPKGFINGFIDLVFRHNGYFYVVDWKSNSLGSTPESFSEEGVRHEMASEGYFIQYLLYSAVLQRYLKELPGFKYDWNRHFGGVRYVFLRGIAVGQSTAMFADRPSEQLLDDIGAVLGLDI